jgi:hypothetical protein
MLEYIVPKHSLGNTIRVYSLYLTMDIENLSEEEKKNQLNIAVEKLYDDYINDPELTIFATALASESFIDNTVKGI